MDVESEDRYFSTLIRPRKLTGKITDEIRYEAGFETNCIKLSRFINQPVKSLTTKEYFTLITIYNAEAKKNK